MRPVAGSPYALLRPPPPITTACSTIIHSTSDRFRRYHAGSLSQLRSRSFPHASGFVHAVQDPSLMRRPLIAPITTPVVLPGHHKRRRRSQLAYRWHYRVHDPAWPLTPVRLRFALIRPGPVGGMLRMANGRATAWRCRHSSACSTLPPFQPLLPLPRACFRNAR